MPMRPKYTEIKGKQATLACYHWREFPPLHSVLDKPIEAQRADKEVSEADYQRYKVWERVCGQKQMGDKCLTCPHVRRLVVEPHKVPKLVTLDGKTSTPAVDITTVSTAPQHRDYLVVVNQKGRPASKG